MQQIRSIFESEGFGNLAMLVGRILLAVPFPIFGINKAIHQETMMAVVETAGIPGAVLYFIIPYQILCGLAVWVGFKTRWATFLLGGFCIVAPILYHSHWSQPHEMSDFAKDFATAGGFLFLWKFGPGKYSIDWLLARRRAEAGRP